RLGFDDGHAQYLAGHLPGAVFVDMDRELSRPGEPSEGRHPLPDDEALEAAARRWGICEGDAVVVYDDARSLPASRLWWALTRAGLRDVRVLDGGLPAWRGGGGRIEQGEVIAEPGDVTLGRPGTADVLDTSQI